jgi:pimeloyl-ACP methyl ester carboxylesterase
MQDQSPIETKSSWRANLAAIGSEEGFFSELGHQHSALFVEGGKTLIVTFENLDHVYENADDRMPWGYGFVASRGWSMLGLMAHDWTWYRDEAVFDFFDSLRDSGFFKRYDRVVFYGASMGAYAAATFSAAAPGARAVLISPQSTLCRETASWETRYVKAWKRDFNSRYGYAPDYLSLANKAYLFYDPHAPLDAMHAALFRGENTEKFKCHFMGHRIASLWAQMGVLKPGIEGAIDGTLTRPEFYRLMRARWESPRFHREVLDQVVARDNPRLTARYCRAILARRRGPKFRQALNAAEAEIAKSRG